MRLVMSRLDVILDAAIMTESTGNTAHVMSDSTVRAAKLYRDGGSVTPRNATDD